MRSMNDLFFRMLGLPMNKRTLAGCDSSSRQHHHSVFDASRNSMTSNCRLMIS